MTRLFIMAVLGLLVSALTGCNGPEKSEPIWEQVKIGDLAPSGSAKRGDDHRLKTINFDVHIFEIPAEGISTLNEAWQMLYTKPLQFNDNEVFSANSFSVGFGRTQMWNKIGELLRTAEGKKTETVSLLLSSGQTNYFTITKLYDERTIFYISTAGSAEAVTVGRGRITLQIKAEKIPGSRGVCRTDVIPMFLPRVKRLITQSGGHRESGEIVFSGCGLGLKMSPGDFLFLGPDKYINNQTTLGGIFFSRPGRKPVFRTFLIVCTSIID